MGKKRLESIKAKVGNWNENRKEMKELKLQQKENQAVYELTCRLMKEDNLTYQQVQECYK
mgnify:CR=1 FL=1